MAFILPTLAFPVISFHFGIAEIHLSFVNNVLIVDFSGLGDSIIELLECNVKFGSEYRDAKSNRGFRLAA